VLQITLILLKNSIKLLGKFLVKVVLFNVSTLAKSKRIRYTNIHSYRAMLGVSQLHKTPQNNSVEE
jgi:hypothetical protein